MNWILEESLQLSTKHALTFLHTKFPDNLKKEVCIKNSYSLEMCENEFNFCIISEWLVKWIYRLGNIATWYHLILRRTPVVSQIKRHFCKNHIYNLRMVLQGTHWWSAWKHGNTTHKRLEAILHSWELQQQILIISTQLRNIWTFANETCYDWSETHDSKMQIVKTLLQFNSNLI